MNEWTDDLVKEFCKIYANGKYRDEYRHCNTMEKKLVVFKRLKRIREIV